MISSVYAVDSRKSISSVQLSSAVPPPLFCQATKPGVPINQFTGKFNSGFPPAAARPFVATTCVNWAPPSISFMLECRSHFSHRPSTTRTGDNQMKEKNQLTALNYYLFCVYPSVCVCDDVRPPWVGCVWLEGVKRTRCLVLQCEWYMCQ